MIFVKLSSIFIGIVMVMSFVLWHRGEFTWKVALLIEALSLILLVLNGVIYLLLRVSRKVEWISHQYLDDAFLITNYKNQIVYANQSFLEMSGYTHDELMGKKPSILKSGLYDKAFYQDMWQKIHEVGYWEGEIVDKRRDGTLFSKKMKIIKYEDKLIRKTYYISVQSNLEGINALKVERDQYKYYSPNKLPNLQAYIEKIEDLKRSEILTFKVLFGKIMNHLKIEGLIGHEAYQLLIYQYSMKIKEHYQGCIEVFELDANSLGFILLKEDPLNDIKDVFEINSQLKTVSGLFVNLQIEYGFSIYPDHDTNPMKLLNKAEMAVDYITNKMGMHWYPYDDELQKINDDEIKLQIEFPFALKNKEFSMQYQPQVDARNNKIIGFEALARWHSPKYGFISPSVFIPLSQKYGFAQDLDFYILDYVFSDYHKIQKKYPNTTLSINVSYYTMQSDLFYGALKKYTQKHKINPKHFVLELTEEQTIVDREKLLYQIDKVKRLGFEISIDDFGTGYNGLSILFELPLNEIKIERSFFKKHMNERDQAILKSIVSLGKEMGVRIVAEGIEYESQKNFLLKHQCKIMQGYLFSKPMTLEMILDSTVKIK